MSSDWVSQFVDALHALEDRGELEPLLSQFSPDAVLTNSVRSEPLHGADQVRHFWTAYRHQFDRIHSIFERIISGEVEAALEWRAEGDLRDGQAIIYRGVTLLKRGEAGITEFASYFDPSPFRADLDATAQTPASQPERRESSREVNHPLRSEEEIEEEAPSVMSYW